MIFLTRSSSLNANWSEPPWLSARLKKFVFSMISMPVIVVYKIFLVQYQAKGEFFKYLAMFLWFRNA